MTEFKEWLAARGLMPGTVELYARAVTLVLARHPADPVQAIREPGLSAQRRSTLQKAVIRWAQFRGDERLEERARAVVIPNRELESRPAAALTLREEWPRVLRALGQRPEPLRSVLLLLAGTGLRIAEVMCFTARELEPLAVTGRAVIVQKGGYERPVALAPSQRALAATLLEWASFSRPVWATLCTPRRRERRAVEDYVRREVAAAGKEAGVAGLHPHTLRHTAGDAILDASDGNMKLVQEALGHRDAKTTARHYQRHGHQEQLSEAFEKALQRAQGKTPDDDA
jgi:integrase